jgi:hypothetical protein
MNSNPVQPLWEKCRECPGYYFDHLECGVGMCNKPFHHRFVPADNLRYLEYRYEKNLNG